MKGKKYTITEAAKHLGISRAGQIKSVNRIAKEG
jgi:hypothetical protein